MTLSKRYLPISAVVMPRLNGTILIQGRPARCLYVEHIWKEWFLSGPIDLYIMDDSGRVRDEQG